MSHLTDEATRVVDLANLPALEPGTDPASPAAQLHQTAVLAAILDAATRATLPNICTWTLDERGLRRHGNAPVVSGQLAVSGNDAASRKAVATWADALGGKVVETQELGYVAVEAQACVSGALVVIWTHVAEGGAR